MATTYTGLLQLPKHDTKDFFDVTLINEMADKTEAGILAAYRGKAAHNWFHNSNFANCVNQKKQTTYTGTVYGIDRWYGRVNNQTTAVRSADVTITATSTQYAGLRQKVENIADLAGKKVTFACHMYSSVTPYLRFVNDSAAILASVAGKAQATETLILTFIVPEGATKDTVIPEIVIASETSGDYARLYWAALYEGEYALKTLPTYQTQYYSHELLECQRFYHLYATEEARPMHGIDCSPPMRINNPTQGTIVIDGVTYYYNSADL